MRAELIIRLVSTCPYRQEARHEDLTACCNHICSAAWCRAGNRAATAIAAEDHSRLDQLHVEDGGERLYLACRSHAGREMELQADTGCVRRCAHLCRAGEARGVRQRGMGEKAAWGKPARPLRYWWTQSGKDKT